MRSWRWCCEDLRCLDKPLAAKLGTGNRISGTISGRLRSLSPRTSFNETESASNACLLVALWFCGGGLSSVKPMLRELTVQREHMNVPLPASYSVA